VNDRPAEPGPGEVDLAFGKPGVLELGVGEGRDDVVQVLDDRGRAVPQVPPVEALLEDLRLPCLDFGLDGAVRLLKPPARPFEDIVESARDEDGLLDGRARVREVRQRDDRVLRLRFGGHRQALPLRSTYARSIGFVIRFARSSRDSARVIGFICAARGVVLRSIPSAL